jgi:hypothetical protein
MDFLGVGHNDSLDRRRVKWGEVFVTNPGNGNKTKVLGPARASACSMRKPLVHFIAFCTVPSGCLGDASAVHSNFYGGKPRILHRVGSEIAKDHLFHQFTNGEACAF